MNMIWKRNLYIILSLFILLAGISFENKKIDSIFISISAEDQPLFLNTASLVKCPELLCTTEMLDQHSISFHENSDDIEKLPVYLLLAGIFSLSLTKFLSTANFILLEELHGQSVLLNYIHKEDGKKRTVSFSYSL